MSVRSFVRPNLSRALILHLSSSNLQAISQQSVSSQSVVSQLSVIQLVIIPLEPTILRLVNFYPSCIFLGKYCLVYLNQSFVETKNLIIKGPQSTSAHSSSMCLTSSCDDRSNKYLWNKKLEWVWEEEGKQGQKLSPRSKCRDVFDTFLTNFVQIESF